jgi:hypothetical protein
MFRYSYVTCIAASYPAGSFVAMSMRGRDRVAIASWLLRPSSRKEIAWFITKDKDLFLSFPWTFFVTIARFLTFIRHLDLTFILVLPCYHSKDELFRGLWCLSIYTQQCLLFYMHTMIILKT